MLMRDDGASPSAQVPPINQFRAHEEDAAEDQHGVGGGSRDRREQWASKEQPSVGYRPRG